MKDLSTIAACIKEYKEIVAAIISFAGGAFWIVGYFATEIVGAKSLHGSGGLVLLRVA